MTKEQDQVGYIVLPIVIEDGIWIALNSIALGGTLGRNSFIVSNSLVIRDLPENSYAYGHPARKIKERFKLEDKTSE